MPPPPRMRRRSRVATLLLWGVTALAGACRGGDRPVEGRRAATETPDTGGTAVLAMQNDMQRPMPLFASSTVDAGLDQIMYMGLLRALWRDGRLVYETSEENPMAMAWLYEYLPPDSTALRFRLRSDLLWSDGTPITAHDVVWTYRTAADPRTASPYQSVTAQLDSVVAENDSTMVFHFRRRYPEMLFDTGINIAPRHVYEGTTPAQLRTHRSLADPANGNLVVSGPFQIGNWQQGQQITLVRNPHFRVRPLLDTIVIRVIPEPTTRLVELQTGGVDMAYNVAFDQIPQIRAQASDVRLERQEKRVFDYVAYNPRAVPAFADPDVRRALGLAIDVPAILRALQMEEWAVPAGGPYPPIFRDLYDPERMAPLPHDPAEARRILESKGWRDSDGDGILERNGRPLRFTLLTNSGNQTRADVSQILQQQWRQIGADVRLQQLEFNTFFDRLLRKNFEAALGGWGVELSPNLTGFWGKDAPFNIVGYENPEATALMEQALAQPTRERALPFWQAAAERIVADQPYTWLYFHDRVSAVNERLRGMRIDSYSAFQNAWEWWIPADRQRGGAAAAPQQ
ncbi:MAG TPA: ABC transporter substrate-binding protein [Longimicrobiaceae bacterium]|nr:ABC transporter substrate-binding protein [Longimicrobiaceae bacterium]